MADSACYGGEIVVAGWFGQLQSGKNRPMFLVQAGALGDGAGLGREGDQPDRVEGVGELRQVSPAAISTVRMSSSASQHSCTWAMIRSVRRW